MLFSFVLCEGPHVPTEVPMETTSPSTVSGSDGCAKCVNSMTGKLSCCARGGAWFEKCGDVGDTQFDHTWAEGIRACKSRFWRDSFARYTS